MLSNLANDTNLGKKAKTGSQDKIWRKSSLVGNDEQRLKV